VDEQERRPVTSDDEVLPDAVGLDEPAVEGFGEPCDVPQCVLK
jgi:hypothetical protein